MIEIKHEEPNAPEGIRRAPWLGASIASASLHLEEAKKEVSSFQWQPARQGNC